MQEILTLTLNPALDLASETPDVRPGPKLRCTAPRRDPGGGGINVARAIHRLGGTARALAALGGPTGAALHDLLAAEGVPLIAHPAPGDTRQSLVVTEAATDAQYRFILPGPVWSEGDVGAFLDRAEREAPPGGLVVLSGSQPPGTPDDLTARLAARLAGTGARLIADISGAALMATARGASALHLLRMDAAEAEEIAGAPLPTREDSASIARTLVARGVARQVIVARGADGAIFASAEACLHVTAPEVPVRSKTGAGDSFVAGLTLSLARGEGAPAALAHASAAASAAVTTPATELCEAATTARLRPLCEVTPLSL
ncbi:1-phosphofructokinase family hexose kinase [Salinihabitans flavidus]|nr:1-phosphofructokinase family hexose kinase [Salinihabitans flavidus]